MAAAACVDATRGARMTYSAFLRIHRTGASRAPHPLPCPVTDSDEFRYLSSSAITPTSRCS